MYSKQVHNKSVPVIVYITLQPTKNIIVPMRKIGEGAHHGKKSD